ncbi:MAG: hypothetical protein HY098_02125 [Nitrospinae bacterium]|nr:hypothetical protein [Nitrospinota bacterium]
MNLAIFFTLGLIVFTQPAQAHCDTMNGPVVLTAMKALEKGDATSVLKWVKKEHEGEIRDLFKKTLAVRSKGPEAKDLADRYFLETLVRLHRAGEGAPYTGLSAEPVEPIVAAVDKSLENGSADHLIKHVSEEVASGIRKRFTLALEKKKHSDESIDAGREFVEAYVEFTHYVERLYDEAKGGSAEHGKVEAHHKH